MLLRQQPSTPPPVIRQRRSHPLHVPEAEEEGSFTSRPSQDLLRCPGRIFLFKEVRPPLPAYPGQTTQDRTSMKAHHEEMLELSQCPSP